MKFFSKSKECGKGRLICIRAVKNEFVGFLGPEARSPNVRCRGDLSTRPGPLADNFLMDGTHHDCWSSASRVVLTLEWMKWMKFSLGIFRNFSKEFPFKLSLALDRWRWRFYANFLCKWDERVDRRNLILIEMFQRIQIDGKRTIEMTFVCVCVCECVSV